MELVHIQGNTYYFKGPVCVGVYFLDKNNVIIFDSGSDKDYGRKILKYFISNNINIRGIINTHSHADHCGGNNFIQKRTNCLIYASDIEESIINTPEIEPLYLFSSTPIRELRNKFLLAEKSYVSKKIDVGFNNLFGEEFEIIDLSGHSLGMIGIRTKDNVTFVADSIFEESIINKYKILYCMDLEKTYKTLENLKSLRSKYYVLSHGGVKTNISKLIKINIDSFENIKNNILRCLIDKPMTREELLREIHDRYNLNINIGQYFLNSSALSAHLAYLSNKGIIKYKINENFLKWELNKPSN